MMMKMKMMIEVHPMLEWKEREAGWVLEESGVTGGMVEWIKGLKD